MLSKFLKTGTKVVPYGTIHAFKNGLGTEWIHIENDIKNNVFCVGLKTIGDSNGIAHILEHTTLCGSEAFPVRDPFFKMLNRSMATFMNAMTGDDLTMYPFSSQNIVDYYNLLDVYLDAVYKPILSEFDFMQEGWRLGPSKDLRTSPLIFKGVVYNEMKGVMADTSNVFVTRHQQALFKDSMYAQVSGGEPSEITNLTHQQLCDYHKAHYHPSNSIIYTFGSFELEKQMKVVEEKFKSNGLSTPPRLKFFAS
jgi:presequence protease